jgi:hypothetical protein
MQVLSFPEQRLLRRYAPSEDARLTPTGAKHQQTARNGAPMIPPNLATPRPDSSHRPSIRPFRSMCALVEASSFASEAPAAASLAPEEPPRAH